MKEEKKIGELVDKTGKNMEDLVVEEAKEG